MAGHGIGGSSQPRVAIASPGAKQKPKKQDGPWGSTEDDLLKYAIQIIHGIQAIQPRVEPYKPGPASLRWSEISDYCFTMGCRRDAKQCRERWVNHLDPNTDHGEQLTEAEGQEVMHWVKLMGKKWAEIGRLMGKTENQVKNYWYQQYKKHMNQTKQQHSRRESHAASHAARRRQIQQNRRASRTLPAPRSTSSPSYPVLGSHSRRTSTASSSFSNPGLTNEAGSPAEYSPRSPHDCLNLSQLQLPSLCTDSKAAMEWPQYLSRIERRGLPPDSLLAAMPSNDFTRCGPATRSSYSEERYHGPRNQSLSSRGHGSSGYYAAAQASVFSSHPVVEHTSPNYSRDHRQETVDPVARERERHERERLEHEQVARARERYELERYEREQREREQREGYERPAGVFARVADQLERQRQYVQASLPQYYSVANQQTRPQNAHDHEQYPARQQASVPQQTWAQNAHGHEQYPARQQTTVPHQPQASEVHRSPWASSHHVTLQPILAQNDHGHEQYSASQQNPAHYERQQAPRPAASEPVVSCPAAAGLSNVKKSMSINSVLN